MRFRNIVHIAGIFNLCMLCNNYSVQASYLAVDILSLTLPAYRMPNLNLPRICQPPEPMILPFYFQINYLSTNNTNWGIELYSDNNQVLGLEEKPANGFSGLRARSEPEKNIPLYWQAYNYDLGVAHTLGTPKSVTTIAGGLGFYPETLNYWGVMYDINDIEKQAWEQQRSKRLIAAVDELGQYPRTGRTAIRSPVYVYFGADIREVAGRPELEYIGQFNLKLFHYPFDFSTGCYATPNPVKPVLGQKVYFNFYTNYPDSKVTIKIYDPTGFPVITLQNTRFWECRNSNYQLVEGGLYLYQIEVEGHLISGTVVVIK